MCRGSPCGGRRRLRLASWLSGRVVASCGHGGGNWPGVRADLGVGAARPGLASPIATRPEQRLRSGPLPAPLFEGDQADIELRLTTTGGSRGPARLSGSIGGVEASAATGVVPRTGWLEKRTLGPLGRGAVVASNWVLESSDPLGFFRFRRKSANGEVGLVLPRFASLSSLPQARG